MKLNIAVARDKRYTHEGAVAFQHPTAAQELHRAVMSCMLWEDEFYESGEEIAKRICGLVPKVAPEKVAAMAVKAREMMKLRHVPLLLVCEMAKHRSHKHLVAVTAERVIQRADELTEILAIYQRGRTGTKKLNKLSRQLQKGIAKAFTKFNEYQLAKYNRDGAVKLRDVLFLTHPKPVDKKQAGLWKRLVNGELETPDTWEVAISATKGEGKREEWERLLKEDKLGGLALIRNLRNMKEAGVNEKLIRSALLAMETERILPFRFIAAARFAPQWEPELEQAMLRCLEKFDKLPGRTVIVVDNSGSMNGAKVSKKSDMDRSDAACALAILVREICGDVKIIGFGSTANIIPARRGFALRDAIKGGPGGGTNTDTALALAEREGYDRIIVITDEQSHQAIRGPKTNQAYFINVASNQNGIGYGPWTHIDGWSEGVLEYIRIAESEQ